MRVNKKLRDYLRVIHRYGMTVEGMSRSGHVHVEISHQGQTRVFAIAASSRSGDPRSLRNFESELKRWSRGSGVTAATPGS